MHDAPADPFAGSLHITLASAETPPSTDLLVAEVMGVCVLLAAGVAGLGFWLDIVLMKGLGCFAAALCAIGSAGTAWSWNVKRVLGPLTLAFADARGPASERPGIDCSVTFERSRPDHVSATLTVRREDLQYQTQNDPVLESYYDETLELVAEADGARHAGRFLVPPAWPLPPSGPRTPHPDRVTWELHLRVALGKRKHELLYFLRARPPGALTA